MRERETTARWIRRRTRHQRHVRARVIIPLAFLAACGGRGPTSLSDATTSVPAPTTVVATTTPSTTAVTTTTQQPTTTAPGSTTTAQPTTTATPTKPGPSTTLGPPPTLPPNQTAVPDCAAKELAASVTVDRATYSAGEQVRFTIRVVNRGSRTCAFTDSARVVVTDHTGTTVYPTAGFGQPGCPMGVAAIPPSYRMGPGQAVVDAQESWDQLHHSCQGPDPGPRYPAGTYTATPTAEGGDGAVTDITVATFRLV